MPTVFNIAKGLSLEYYNRVKNNDPATSALLIVAINNGGTTEATMQDYDTLSALLGDAGVAEVTNSGYARKVLTDTELAALPAPDDTNNWRRAALPTQTWTAVAAGTAWTHLVVCYRNATADADTAIIPLSVFAFDVTPSGADIQMTGGDFYQAG